MLAFIIACFAETASKQVNIYRMYAASVFLWILYAFMYNDTLYTIMNLIIFTINIGVLIPNWRTKIDYILFKAINT